MTILICAASKRELAALAPAVFPDAAAIPEMRPMAAKIGARNVIFLATGVGPINTAMALGFCLGLSLNDRQKTVAPKIEAILYAGLAGAYDLEKCPLRSIWQVRQEIWPEYGLNDGVSVTARAFSFPLWEPAGGAPVYDRLELADISALDTQPSFKAEPWPQCSSLTVAGVSASFARKEKLWNDYRAELENMEGFAAAYAAARAEVPCVEIRAVSNKVGPRSRDEKDFDGALLALGEILPTLNIS